MLEGFFAASDLIAPPLAACGRLWGHRAVPAVYCGVWEWLDFLVCVAPIRV